MKLAIYSFLFMFSFLSLSNFYQEWSWDICLNGFMIMSCLGFLGWIKTLDYKQVKLRGFLLGICFYILSLVLTYPLTFFDNMGFVDTIRSMALFIWLTYILFRKERNHNSKLNNKDIFIVRIKPKTFQDTLISMFGCGLGGYGVYHNKNFYHYRKGVFVKDSEKVLINNKKKYIVMKSQNKNLQIIDNLEGMLGSKWSLRNNCVTKVRKMIR